MPDAIFIGSVMTEWLVEIGPDRQMRLLCEFSFVDPRGKRWTAPLGALVDGASIPHALWSVVGSPFTGDYRRASVLHDHYCQVKTEPHKAVHRMFYEAMLSDGVGPTQAAYIYQAVRFFGPKWRAAAGSAIPMSTAAPHFVPDVDALEAAIDAALGE
jgi:hypothetical protein